MQMNVVWLLILAGVISLMLTGLLRRYALKKNLLDMPNSRSSHSEPTPRGGGVAIVLVVLVGSLFLWWWDLVVPPILCVLFGVGGLVAIIGWLDDHVHVAARWRLLVHFVAAALALTWQGGLPPVVLFGAIVDLGWLGYVLGAIYLVWLLNLYNFMDGIDGIAGIEAVIVSMGGAVLYFLSSAGGREWLLPMLLAVAVLGFLFWNFPKAKIFMGDAGSGFIGIVLGVFSIQAAWAAPELFWGWVILMGAFVVDATVTLLRRVRRGEKFFEAHRSHAYQYAARKYNSHAKVTLFFGMINLTWLTPIAMVVVSRWLDGLIGVIIAYIPLVLLAIQFNAGAKELQDI